MTLETKATLRVFSKTHSLLDLTTIIGKPTGGFSIGGFSIGDSFSRGVKTREYTYWSRCSTLAGEKEALEAHLSDVLDFSEGQREGLL